MTDLKEQSSKINEEKQKILTHKKKLILDLVTGAFWGILAGILIFLIVTQYQTITLTTGETMTFHVNSYEINLIDILPYPISTKDISEEYVATITISKNKKEIVLPPLKQSKNGIKANLIDCKPTLVLIIKNSDGSPACVKPDTKSRLFERGWATIPI